MISAKRRSAKYSILLGLLALPLWAANDGRPGTINYVEGDAAINGVPLSYHSVGSTEAGTGQILDTEDGKVEVLLTPGAFLRLGSHSALQVVSASLTDTTVALQRGEAMVEVTNLMKETTIRVDLAGGTATIEKNGLYAFNAEGRQVSVFDGKATVTLDGQTVHLGKGHMTLLDGNLRSQHFDRNRHDSLYAWSDVRSEYLAEASASSASAYLENTGGWLGAGWYWNPWWSMCSFIPGNGICYSPFGWGFYAPRYVGYAPGWGYGYRGYGYHRGGLMRGPASRAVAGGHIGGGGHFGGAVHGR